MEDRRVIVVMEKDLDTGSQLCWGKTYRENMLEKVASSF